jgi:hypothetical protein
LAASRYPRFAGTYFEPNVERSTTEKCVVQAAARCSAPSAFLELATAIEAVCTELGDALFADDERTRWYKAARKLAANDNVRLYGSLFQEAGRIRAL